MRDVAGVELQKRANPVRLHQCCDVAAEDSDISGSKILINLLSVEARMRPFLREECLPVIGADPQKWEWPPAGISSTAALPYWPDCTLLDTLEVDWTLKRGHCLTLHNVQSTFTGPSVGSNSVLMSAVEHLRQGPRLAVTVVNGSSAQTGEGCTGEGWT
nr:hypothetical protein CFP56_10991 [Quercus suber]